MPEELFSHTASTTAPPRRVWEALNRPETWEAIPGVDRVTSSTVDERGRLVGFEFATTVAGRSYRGEASPAGREEGSVLAWHIASPEVGGSITVTIHADGPGTEVRVELLARSTGMLSKMFFPLIASTIGTGFPNAVDNFAARLERG